MVRCDREGHLYMNGRCTECGASEDGSPVVPLLILLAVIGLAILAALYSGGYP